MLQSGDNMKFIRQSHLAKIVWNPKRDRPLAEFDRDGFFETDDKETIDILSSMGYERINDEQSIDMQIIVKEDSIDAEPVEPPSEQEVGIVEEADKEEAAVLELPDKKDLRKMKTHELVSVAKDFFGTDVDGSKMWTQVLKEVKNLYDGVE